MSINQIDIANAEEGFAEIAREVILAMGVPAFIAELQAVMAGSYTDQDVRNLVTANPAAFRLLMALGTASLAASDNDNTLAANSATALATQQAVKGYVDAKLAGQIWKASVRVGSVVNGTLSTAFANGQVVDGVTLATGDRILIKAQTTGSENGIYTVNASGAPTRAPDADTGTKLKNATVTVDEGSQADWQWTVSNNGTITLGTTSLVFVTTGGGGRLMVPNNLSDVANPAVALSNIGGQPMTLPYTTPASTATTAGLKAPHGAAPTTPVDGDVWTTTAGVFARINGATVGLLAAGGSLYPEYISGFWYKGTPASLAMTGSYSSSASALSYSPFVVERDVTIARLASPQWTGYGQPAMFAIYSSVAGLPAALLGKTTDNGTADQPLDAALTLKAGCYWFATHLNPNGVSVGFKGPQTGDPETIKYVRQTTPDDAHGYQTNSAPIGKIGYYETRPAYSFVFPSAATVGGTSNIVPGGSFKVA